MVFTGETAKTIVFGCLWNPSVYTWDLYVCKYIYSRCWDRDKNSHNRILKNTVEANLKQDPCEESRGPGPEPATSRHGS